MGKCHIPAGGRGLIPGVMGQNLSPGAGRGLGPFPGGGLSHCRSTSKSLSPVPASHQHSQSLPATGGFLCSGKSECLPFSAASIQEITAPFFLTKSKWAWQLLGRGPQALFPSGKMEVTLRIRWRRQSCESQRYYWSFDSLAKLYKHSFAKHPPIPRQAGEEALRP